MKLRLVMRRKKNHTETETLYTTGYLEPKFVEIGVYTFPNRLYRFYAIRTSLRVNFIIECLFLHRANEKKKHFIFLTHLQKHNSHEIKCAINVARCVTTSPTEELMSAIHHT